MKNGQSKGKTRSALLSPRAKVCVWTTILACMAGCANGGIGERSDPYSKITFKSVDGEIAFQIELGDGVDRVSGRTGNRLVSLYPTPDGLEIENLVGQRIGLVVSPQDDQRGFRILEIGSLNALFELRKEPDGDFKLFNSNDEVLYDIKKREYGFKVIDRNGAVGSRIRLKPGKISVKDAEGVTYLFTRDSMPADAVAALTLEAVPIEYAAALAVAIIRTRSQTE